MKSYFYSQNLRRLLCVAGLLPLLACTRFGQPIERVVERSKLEVPEWVENTPAEGRLDRNRFTFVRVQSDVIDLPAGVKAAEGKSLTISREALTKVMQERIESMASESQLAVKNQNDFQQIIADATEKDHQRYARVADIYYERIEAPEAELNRFYRIYIRIDYPSKRLNRVLSSISSKFKQSPHQDLRQVSTKMTNGFEQLLGH